MKINVMYLTNSFKSYQKAIKVGLNAMTIFDFVKYY